MSLRTLISSIAIVATALTAAGCMTVRDSISVVQSADSSVFANKRIALLPVKAQTSLAPDSVLAMRAEIARKLGPALKGKIPSATISDIATVADGLNQKNLLPVFEQLILTYENTGVLDRQRVTALGRALGVDFLLLSRLKSEKMDLVISSGTGGSLDLSIINVNSGEIAWGGSGEWKKGGIFGFGSATPVEVANGLVTQALGSLR